jgi:transposase
MTEHKKTHDRIQKNKGEMEMSKSSKRYTDEFKRQIVALKSSGRSTAELMREYDLTKTSINLWTRQMERTGSFREADNLSESEKELRILRKENKQLRMENDILKQAALILGQRSK